MKVPKPMKDEDLEVRLKHYFKKYWQRRRKLLLKHANETWIDPNDNKKKE